jgi:predicted DNA-binding transcriptional regulator AlpA
MADKSRSYLTASQVRERFGGRSSMWLWRKLRDDPLFPKPLPMGQNIRLFDVQELDRYDDALREKESE